MGWRQTFKKQRKIIRQQVEKMSKATIDANKLVKARRQGWVLGAVMGGLTGGTLAALACWLILHFSHRL